MKKFKSATGGVDAIGVESAGEVSLLYPKPFEGIRARATGSMSRTKFKDYVMWRGRVLVNSAPCTKGSGARKENAMERH